jgi:hypothetical protein
MFRIPTTVKLFGSTVSTEFDEELVTRTGNEGEADFLNKKIRMQPPIEGYKIDIESEGEIYCHELVHWILYAAGFEKDTHNEKKVEIIGKLLHQALNTMEYNEDIDNLIKNGYDNCMIEEIEEEIEIEEVKIKKNNTKK